MEKPRVIGQSAAMQHIRELVESLASVDATVMISGEHGVGRSTVAEYLHLISRRSSGPLVSARLTDAARVESEFARAEQGTIILRNADEMSLAAQTAVLQSLAPAAPSGNVRVIAIVSPLLRQRIEEGTFREDLYYRLNVVPLFVPPLRERPDDIVPLALHFLGLTGRRREIHPAAMEALLEYHWPGNVEELRNVITRACLLSTDTLIQEHHFALDRPSRTGSEQLLSYVKLQLEERTRQLDELRSTTIRASPIWEGSHFSTLDDLCFVLMPFGDSHDVQHVFESHVKPTANVWRCDAKERTTSMVLRGLCRASGNS